LGLLAPKFRRELRRGSRVVTFDFPIFGWKSDRGLSFTPKGWKKAHPIYLYLVQRRRRSRSKSSKKEMRLLSPSLGEVSRRESCGQLVCRSAKRLVLLREVKPD